MLSAHLTRSIEKSPKKYTSEIFSENEFSKRLNINVDQLTDFRNEAFHTLVGINLIAAVEYLLYYIKDVETYRSIVSASEYELISDEKPEEQLAKKLKVWLTEPLESEIIKTVKYLRLRRNHIAHLREELTQEFTFLIKNNSNNLNIFWSKKYTNIYDFDFSNRDVAIFSESDALALINLVLVCAKIIDEKILSSISSAEIIKYESIRFSENHQLNHLTAEKKIRKFKGYLNRTYGVNFDCNDTDFELYANKIQ